MRVAVLGSTGGAVYREASLRSAHLSESITLVVSDRECGALESARRLGHRTLLLPWRSSSAFSDALLGALQDARIDVCVSFFTRLLSGGLLSAFEGRLINFHPTLLPQFPGMKGLQESFRSGAQVLGTTVHAIDAGCDTGAVLQQTRAARSDYGTEPELRHALFNQQCRSLIQVVRWYAQGRIGWQQGRFSVTGARYGDFDFTPALDDAEAAACAIPYSAS